MHVRRQHGMMHFTAGNDDTGGDDRIRGVAEAVASCVNEFRRRQCAGIRVDRPCLVVQVELGHVGDQIHVRIVELLERAHVAPIGVIGVRGPRNHIRIEVVDACLAARGEVRRDVAAHIMLGVFVLRILGQCVEQGVGVGHVVAHRRQEGVRVVGQTRAGVGLFQERLDLIRMIGVDIDHAELVRLFDRLTDAGHGELGTGLDMLLDHLAEVHTVNMIGTDDHHDIGLHILDDIDGLIDGVGGTQIPVLAQTLLRRHRGYVVAEQRGEAPHLGDMPIQRV